MAAQRTEPIEWRLFPRDSPRVRWIVAGLAGLVLGGGASVGAVAAASVGWLSGPVLASVLVLVGVGVAGALAWYRDARERTPLADAVAIDAAGVRWLPLAAGVAAGLVLALPWLGEVTAAQLGLVGSAAGALGFVLVGNLRGTGRFDPESGVATVEGRVYDLERAPTTAVPLAGLTVVVVRRPAPAVVERYGVVAMPTHVYETVARTTTG